MVIGAGTARGDGVNTSIRAPIDAPKNTSARRKPIIRTGLLVVCLTMLSLTGTQPATASNDSYCGHGSSGIFLHNWFTERWYNEWWDHVPPNGWGGHWNHYQKWWQPSYYPGTALAWLWFDGGQIWKSGPGCI